MDMDGYCWILAGTSQVPSITLCGRAHLDGKSGGDTHAVTLICTVFWGLQT